jgi:hypothetical protein
MKERCHSNTTNNDYSSGYVNPCDNYYSPSHTYTPYNNGGHYTTCKCCCGTGIQTRCDGIRICCPACHGSGRVWVPCKTYHPCNPRPCYPKPYYPTIWCTTSNNSNGNKFV